MRALLFVSLTLACASAQATEYYWTISDRNLNGQQFPTPDAACQAAYPGQVKNLSSAGYAVLPYAAPYFDPSVPPKNGVMFDCPFAYFNPSKQNPVVMSFVETISRNGDGCKDGETYNPQVGKCEAPTDDQDRKEEGDQDSPLISGAVSVGVVSCNGVATLGNPINAGAGNKFQNETDYQDTDGELRFARFYNGKTGQWRHSYATSLFSSSTALVITFEDGRSTLFNLTNGVATGEATELGNLAQVGGLWVYTAPTNEQFTFDATGRLTRWQQASGLAQTLTYVVASNGDSTVTVTDSRGHTMQFIDTKSHAPKSFSANGSAGTFAYNTMGQLVTVTRTWPGHSTTSTYVYEDTRNASWLTGIIDERGVRYATWAYDAQGRAISSQHAGGAEKVTLTYNSDGSTTATNALGNTTVYQYQVIQGIKRVTAIQGSPTAGCPASNSTYTYYPNGQVQTMTDALGNVTALTYDTLGRELTRVEAKGTPQERTTTTTWWDATHFLPKTVTTPDRVTTYSYDTQGRLQSTSVHAIKG